jgi:hypothetical protein
VRWLLLVSLGTSGCCDVLRVIEVGQAVVELASVPAQVTKAVESSKRCGTAEGEGCKTPRPDLSPYLRGKVVVSAPLGMEAVPFTEVALMREGRTIVSVATDRGGVFFVGYPLPAGPYDLVLRSDLYRAQRSLFLDEARQDLLVIAQAAGP